MSVEVQSFDEPPGLAGSYARALLEGPRGLLRSLTGGGDGEPSAPELEMAVDGVRVDREHLRDYCRVCGYRLADRLPPTYPHLLGFSASLQLMTDDRFPFPLMGLVHVANRIVAHQPLRAGEPVDVRVRAERLRSHPKGAQIDLVTEVSVDGAPAWEEHSSYLRRGARAPEPSEPTGDGLDAPEADVSDRPDAQEAVWKVPGDIGRRYAAVAGDINPIHLHGLSARALGFPSAIAHGMWTKARSLAALEGRIPDRYEVDVGFMRPLLLPARAGFASAASDEGMRFSVRDVRRDQQHLSGVLRPRPG